MTKTHKKRDWEENKANSYFTNGETFLTSKWYIDRNAKFHKVIN